MTVYPTEYPASEAIALIIDSKQIRLHHKWPYSCFACCVCTYLHNSTDQDAAAERVLTFEVPLR
jgi:hypothetical protein